MPIKYVWFAVYACYPYAAFLSYGAAKYPKTGGALIIGGCLGAFLGMVLNQIMVKHLADVDSSWWIAILCICMFGCMILSSFFTLPCLIFLNAILGSYCFFRGFQIICKGAGYPNERMLYAVISSGQTSELSPFFWLWLTLMILTALISIYGQFQILKFKKEQYALYLMHEDSISMDYKTLRQKSLQERFNETLK